MFDQRKPLPARSIVADDIATKAMKIAMTLMEGSCPKRNSGVVQVALSVNRPQLPVLVHWTDCRCLLRDLAVSAAQA